jgi:drug/metabolite transporter (DMT)-like permease
MNQPPLIGTLLALVCALSISMSIVLNKKLIQVKIRQSLIMLYFLLTSLIILLIIRIHYWVFSKEFNFTKIFLTKDFLLASMITILQFIPMVFSQKAIKREHPSIITVVQSSDILFALILQNIFTSIKTNLLALMGSILVLTSIFIVGGHKLWLDRRNRTCLPKK